MLERVASTVITSSLGLRPCWDVSRAPAIASRHKRTMSHGLRPSGHFPAALISVEATRSSIHVKCVGSGTMSVQCPSSTTCHHRHTVTNCFTSLFEWVMSVTEKLLPLLWGIKFYKLQHILVPLHVRPLSKIYSPRDMLLRCVAVLSSTFEKLWPLLRRITTGRKISQIANMYTYTCAKCM